MKTVEERLKSYEPLWENWTYSGEFLGEGAMSSVFEIRSTAMGLKEVAALKIITVKKNFRGEVKIPENALNEIKILRELSGCPNIVQYHDSTQRNIYNDDNELSEIDILIKMEKLQPLSEETRLSEEQVIRLAKDICNALIHADEHGIIHRDIKPQNIFVDKEGTYKLGDFGIAKIVSEFSSSYTMNVGTLAYTAPEVRGGTSGKYDISSDVYSLGLVLYVYLNNGRMPFASTSSTLNEAIIKRISGAAFPSPPRGSKNLKTIVMRACNSDVNKRYKSPAEMLEDLELLSTGGKRMVVDPFATLDANIDVSEYDEIIIGTGASDASGGAAVVDKKPDDYTTGGRLKITMGGGKKPLTDTSSGLKSTIPTKKPATEMGTSSSGTGSKLKINMGSRAPKSAECMVKTESDSGLLKTPETVPEVKKEEKKTIPSYFSTPEL